MELYKKHRPKNLEEVVGQDLVINTLKAKLAKDDVPHTIIFHGPSGCGKTSTARALAKALGCQADDRRCMDYTELNAAKSRGIDDVRTIEQRMQIAPIQSKCRVWVLDECHEFTRNAQEALLKILEDTPSHVYFMLCTTLLGKLILPIKNRGMKFALKSLKRPVMDKLLARVLKLEKASIGEELQDKIIELAEGSPREALNLLEKALTCSDEDEALSLLEKADEEATGFQLAQLLFNPKAQWREIAKKIQDLDQEPETARRVVLGYAANVLLSGKMAARAYLILTVFESNFYDSGKAGLVRACYEVMGSK